MKHDDKKKKGPVDHLPAPKDDSVIAESHTTEDQYDATENHGFMKLMRNRETMELLENHPNEFLLLSLVAQRARRTKYFSSDNLEPGEALIGDPGACGLTRQKYRNAVHNLEKWGFLAIRTTNRGTIAKLINTRVYDINISEGNQQKNQQATNSQPSGNQQPTTNKEVKKVRKKENKNEREEAQAPHVRVQVRSNILLTEGEYMKVHSVFKEETEAMLDFFSTKKEANGYTYKRDVQAILGWVVSAWREHKLRTAELDKREERLKSLQPMRPSSPNRRIVNLDGSYPETGLENLC